MPRGQATFRQADLARAVRAVQAVGLKVSRTEIGPDGRIVLHHEDAPAPVLSPLEEWRAKRDARPS
jgi:hypothetical protein